MKFFILFMRLCWGDIDEGGCSPHLFISSEDHKNFLVCMMDGHEKSLDAYKSLKPEDINKSQIRFEFWCEEDIYSGGLSWKQ